MLSNTGKNSWFWVVLRLTKSGIEYVILAGVFIFCVVRGRILIFVGQGGLHASWRAQRPIFQEYRDSLAPQISIFRSPTGATGESWRQPGQGSQLSNTWKNSWFWIASPILLTLIPTLYSTGQQRRLEEFCFALVQERGGEGVKTQDSCQGPTRRPHRTCTRPHRPTVRRRHDVLFFARSIHSQRNSGVQLVGTHDSRIQQSTSKFAALPSPCAIAHTHTHSLTLSLSHTRTHAHASSTCSPGKPFLLLLLPPGRVRCTGSASGPRPLTRLPVSMQQRHSATDGSLLAARRYTVARPPPPLSLVD